MADNILESLSASNIFDLRGVVAVVTGGGTGIGMMISSTLVANGATVYIIGPGQEELNKVCALYNAATERASTGGRMHALEGDVSSKTEAKRLSSEIASREPHGITVLFNNAGIHAGRYARPAPTAPAAAYVSAFFDGVSEEAFADTLRTNAVGPYWLTFAFLPLLETWKKSAAEVAAARKFAPQVIMTSSMNGWTKDPATGGLSFPYLFSKSALGHATASLAHELLPLGIRVNGIAPGFFPTQMTTQSKDALGISTLPPGFAAPFAVPSHAGSDAGIGANASTIAPDSGAGAGTPRDMGALALFLVANWFVNGETVLIDGGTLLKHPSSY
ncbi:NAD(P)-binding protein [Mycena rebaudengoi]|nr:NAD(P)-binding protein [Mycena rebaudengoi]KAJ7286560.1 NAD(P)-binding protein [Mycena rebaudengoi]